MRRWPAVSSSISPRIELPVLSRSPCRWNVLLSFSIMCWHSMVWGPSCWKWLIHSWCAVASMNMLVILRCFGVSMMSTMVLSLGRRVAFTLIFFRTISISKDAVAGYSDTGQHLRPESRHFKPKNQYRFLLFGRLLFGSLLFWKIIFHPTFGRWLFVQYLQSSDFRVLFFFGGQHPRLSEPPEGQSWHLCWRPICREFDRTRDHRRS